VEPDFGTALIFLPVTFVMMYVAGVPRRTILGMLGTGVLVVGVFLGALFVPELAGAKEETQVKIRKVLHLKEYHKDRIKVFLGIDSDPLGAGWNKVQSEIAVGSGGFLGKGYMCGTQNMLGFLPRSVTPTDFIFSVIAEEKGFVGSMVVLLLFAAILITGTYAAVTVRDKFGRLLCTGIVGMIFVHVFINVAMTVGMMPIIGVPLPLVSYGGSFTVVMMAVIGIMQSVYIRSRPSTGSYSL
jgi:rod shape determining protein RodA